MPVGLDRSTALARRAAIVLTAVCAVVGYPVAALAHSRSYGGRAKTEGVGTPTDSGASSCGHGIYSGPRTGCTLSRHVFSVFARGERKLGHPPGWVRASGAKRHSTQRFTCYIAGNEHFVVCYAKSGALVDFASRRAAPTAAASARPTAHCGYLNGHGLSVRLPLRASGVSCRRARKLAAAWQKRARSGARSSPCIPDQGGAPHKSCVVQSWKCTAGQSSDGATIPVACTRRRQRVQFKTPV